MRNLRGATTDETQKVQKYLLGLALLAATHEIDLFLREGCHLRYAATEDAWSAIPRRGNPNATNLGSKAAEAIILDFAFKSAEELLKADDQAKNAWPPISAEYQFSLAEAKKLLAKKEEEHPDEGEK